MSNGFGNSPESRPTAIHCPQCGQAMLVAPEHLQMPVACPHCQHTLEPWRLAATMAPGEMPPGVPPSPALSPAPSPAYGYGVQGDRLYSWRNRWVAGALGVLLGTFGVHRFYLGFVGMGVVQIIVSLVTCGVGGIWGFIEGILCFCGAMRDVDGLPLRD